MILDYNIYTIMENIDISYNETTIEESINETIVNSTSSFIDDVLSNKNALNMTGAEICAKSETVRGFNY